MSVTPNHVDLIPPPWRHEALCAQTDPEAFYPEKGGSTREAKQVCARCDIRTACLEYALDHDERFGIWGGMSERERRRIKRTIPTDDRTLDVDFDDGGDDFSQEIA